MLSDSSYLNAIYVYVAAACAIVLYLGWWLRRHWRPAWVVLAVLLSAALLLTPAYPREGVETLAPALVVAAFQLLLEGPEAAGHALRPLALMSGLAVAASCILWLLVFRRRGVATGSPAGPGQQS